MCNQDMKRKTLRSRRLSSAPVNYYTFSSDALRFSRYNSGFLFPVAVDILRTCHGVCGI